MCVCLIINRRYYLRGEGISNSQLEKQRERERERVSLWKRSES